MNLPQVGALYHCVFCLAMCIAPVQAKETPPPAYQLAAQQAGIPSVLLYAVALQESGIHFRGRQVPWPWTLNVAGQARRFQTREAACTNLQHALEEMSATRVDVGLGQINAGYQAHRFNHACDLLDPYRNLAIAAAILQEQHKPGEDWLLAAGRYHRPAGGTPAVRYSYRVNQHLLRMHDNPVPLTVSRSSSR